MHGEAEDNVGSLLFSRMLTELVKISKELVKLRPAVSLMLNYPSFNP